MRSSVTTNGTVVGALAGALICVVELNVFVGGRLIDVSVRLNHDAAENPCWSVTVTRIGPASTESGVELGVMVRVRFAPEPLNAKPGKTEVGFSETAE